jgi:cell division control protein 6
VNCRKERTSYKVLNKVIHLLDSKFPKRGFSSQDLLDILIDLLNHQDLHILIALDELNYLINKDDDLIYSLTRVNEGAISGKQRISLIGIVRDIICLNNLDNSTMSTLQRNIIKFSTYSKEQIFDILKYRTNVSLHKNVISNKMIEMISDITFNSGDVRYGLNLLWRASKIADSKNLKYITTDCIRLANQDLLPFSTSDVLNYMNNEQLTFLLAIVKELGKGDKIEISLSEVLKRYYIICENTKLSPRSHSQLWIYLQEFKKNNIILINVISEGIRGRRALIKISDLSLPKLEKNIIKLLNSNGLII